MNNKITIEEIVREFRHEFERDDGLINKYTYYGCEEQDGEMVGPNSMPDAIAIFLKRKLTSFKESVEEEAVEKVCDLIDTEYKMGRWWVSSSKIRALLTKTLLPTKKKMK